MLPALRLAGIPKDREHLFRGDGPPRAPPTDLPQPWNGVPPLIFMALSQVNRSETQYPCS